MRILSPDGGKRAMPEEGLETQELKEALEEQQHHAHGHAEGHAAQVSWITWLSLSTALIAAMAAVASLYGGSLANEAIVIKNDAVLLQAKATDAWGFYQAKKIKQHIYTTTAEIMPEDKRAKAEAEAQREAEEAKKAQAEAREMDKGVLELNEQSAHALHAHHIFAKAVTIFQVAIALAAIAALTRRRAMWLVSLVGGLGGLAFFVYGFLQEHPQSGHGASHETPAAAASAPEHH
jgi:hypothetical protein